jgi:hypothetical protein
MPEVKINNKFSIVYDPENNDRPMMVKCYGVTHERFSSLPEWVYSMFYALLEKQQNEENAAEANVEITMNQMELFAANDGDPFDPYNWHEGDIDNGRRPSAQG